MSAFTCQCPKPTPRDTKGECAACYNPILNDIGITDSLQADVDAIAEQHDQLYEKGLIEQ